MRAQTSGARRGVGAAAAGGGGQDGGVRLGLLTPVVTLLARLHALGRDDVDVVPGVEPLG